MTTLEVLEDFIPVKLRKRMTTEDLAFADKYDLKNAIIADAMSPAYQKPRRHSKKDMKLKFSKDYDIYAFDLGVAAVELNMEEMDENII